MLFDFTTICRPCSTWESDAPCRREQLAKGLTLLFVDSGSAEVWCGDNMLTLKTGELVATANFCVYALEEKSRLLGLTIDGSMAAGFASRLDAPLKTASAQAAQLIRLLHAAEHHMPPHVTCAWCFSLICALSDATALKTAPPLISAAIALIRENYDTVYGVEELAAALGISKSHLVRAFARFTGSTPGQYLTSVRLEAAKQLLQNRALPLEAIAGSCGFSGANYFCKVFMRECGMTPTAYRNSITEKFPLADAERVLENRIYL